MKGGEGTVPARLAAALRQTDIHPASRHVLRLPESPESDPESMPWPSVLVIEEREDGVFLDRLTDAGASAGDTWHASVDDAKEQALDEYDGLLTEWKAVPSEVQSEDLVSFVISQAR